MCPCRSVHTCTCVGTPMWFLPQGGTWVWTYTITSSINFPSFILPLLNPQQACPPNCLERQLFKEKNKTNVFSGRGVNDWAVGCVPERRRNVHSWKRHEKRHSSRCRCFAWPVNKWPHVDGPFSPILSLFSSLFHCQSQRRYTAHKTLICKLPGDGLKYAQWSQMKDRRHHSYVSAYLPFSVNGPWWWLGRRWRVSMLAFLFSVGRISRLCL